MGRQTRRAQRGCYLSRALLRAGDWLFQLWSKNPNVRDVMPVFIYRHVQQSLSETDGSHAQLCPRVILVTLPGNDDNTTVATPWWNTASFSINSSKYCSFSAAGNWPGIVRETKEQSARMAGAEEMRENRRHGLRARADIWCGRNWARMEWNSTSDSRMTCVGENGKPGNTLPSDITISQHARDQKIGSPTVMWLRASSSGLRRNGLPPSRH